MPNLYVRVSDFAIDHLRLSSYPTSSYQFHISTPIFFICVPKEAVYPTFQRTPFLILSSMLKMRLRLRFVRLLYLKTYAEDHHIALAL